MDKTCDNNVKKELSTWMIKATDVNLLLATVIAILPQEQLARLQRPDVVAFAMNFDYE